MPQRGGLDQGRLGRHSSEAEPAKAHGRPAQAASGERPEHGARALRESGARTQPSERPGGTRAGARQGIFGRCRGRRGRRSAGEQRWRRVPETNTAMRHCDVTNGGAVRQHAKKVPTRSQHNICTSCTAKRFTRPTLLHVAAKGSSSAGEAAAGAAGRKPVAVELLALGRRSTACSMREVPELHARPEEVPEPRGEALLAVPVAESAAWRDRSTAPPTPQESGG